MELTRDYFDQQLSSLNKHLDQLPTQDDFQVLKGDFDSVKSEVRSVKAQLSEMQHTLDELNTRDLQDSNAFAKSLVKHDERLTKIEKQLKLSTLAKNN